MSVAMSVAVLQVDTRDYPYQQTIRTWPGGSSHADMLHRYTVENPRPPKREYLALTPLINAWQCRHLGWTFEYITRTCPEGRHPSWVKLDFVLKNWDSLGEVTVVLDTDAWIRDAEGLAFALRTKLCGNTLFLGVEEPQCHETSSTQADDLNGGFMVFKKHPGVKAFFERVWTLGNGEWATRWPWEQACMCRAYRDNAEECREWIHVLPLTTANTPSGSLVSHCWYKDHTLDVALGDFLSMLAKPLLGVSRNTIELVVARYDENLEWLDRWTPYVDRITVYDKSDTPFEKLHPNVTVRKLPNVGREAHSYLTHFVDTYDDLCDVVICTQGRYDDHLSDTQFDKLVRYSENPPTAKGLDVSWGKSVMQHHGWTSDRAWRDQTMQPAGMTMGKFFLKYIADDLVPESDVHWWYGAIFRTTKDRITANPVEKYEALLPLLEVGSNPEMAHMLERAWGCLLTKNRIGGSHAAM